jgi:hypothetical protein
MRWAPGKDGNALMPEQVKWPNPWRKMMMMNEIGRACSTYGGVERHIQGFGGET